MKLRFSPEIRNGNKARCPLSPLLLNTVLEVLAAAIRKQKEIKHIYIGKNEVKWSLFTGDLILYVENPKESAKNKQRNPNY